MAIILKANKLNLFVSSVLFVFWYHSSNFLDTTYSSYMVSALCNQSQTYTLCLTLSFHAFFRSGLLVLNEIGSQQAVTHLPYFWPHHINPEDGRKEQVSKTLILTQF
jgi:hypothetical protein